MPKPLTIRVSTGSPEFPWLRQTPGRLGVWRGHRFVVDEPVDQCDAWFVFEGLSEPQRSACPASRVFLITGEPPAIRSYRPGFVAQFSHVLTCHRDLAHPSVILRQQALPWHIGLHRSDGNKAQVLLPDRTVVHDYDALAAMGDIIKTREMSVICSSKVHSKGHRRRLRFVEALSKHFGTRLDVFGAGIRHVADKWDAIAPYRYHITIENSNASDYWTEKLADAYLGGALPLYGGCPNLDDYFPADSFVMLDTDRPCKAIAQIEDALSQSLFERNSAAISHARGLVLDKYNLFAVMTDLAESHVDGERRLTCVRPETEFPKSSSLSKGVARLKQFGRSLIPGR